MPYLNAVAVKFASTIGGLIWSAYPQYESSPYQCSHIWLPRRDWVSEMYLKANSFL